MKNVIMALFVLLPVVGPAVLPPPDTAPVVISHTDGHPPPRLVFEPPPNKEEIENDKNLANHNEPIEAPYKPSPEENMEAFILQMGFYYGMTDPGDFYDTRLTYDALTIKLGREPDIREILYMIIWTEYWFAVKGKTHALLGQEALARSYYHFCGEDGDCTHEELIKFLTGYQPWFGNLAKIDMKHGKRADKLYDMLTNEFNYSVNGEEVYGYVDEILDVEFAEEQGWTSGKQWNRPSQWYGPAGPPPPGATVGSYSASYAIVCVKYGGGYFYFVTYGQEQTFTPTALP